MRNKIVNFRFRGGLRAMLVFFAGVTLSARAATFEQQRSAMGRTLQTQPEAAVMELLTAGLAENSPVLALADVRNWLQINQPEDALLLYQAGRAAELSGDTQGAVALYQQYLRNADLKSAAANEAVYAVYTLLLDHLQDASAAYLYSRNQGDRLLVCPQARQFDAWYLDEAMKRQDAVAVAKRLQACIAAGLPADLMVARYVDYALWLFDQINTMLLQGAEPTDELTGACRQLAQTRVFGEEWALRLDWAIAVKAYNYAKYLGNDARPPLAEATVLLDKYPQLARWVQDGWMGGNGVRSLDVRRVGDMRKYWSHETAAKMTTVVSVMSKLPASEQANLVRSWQAGYYEDKNRGVDLKFKELSVVKNFLDANPGILKAAQDSVREPQSTPESFSEGFKKKALTPEQKAWIEAGDPERACQALLALPASADAATAAAALKQAIDGVKASPVRMGIAGLDNLAAVPAPVFADKAVMDLVLEVTGGLRYNGGGAFAARLFEHVRENPDPGLIYRSAACLWLHIPSSGRVAAAYNDMLALIESQPSVAYVLSSHGVRALAQMPRPRDSKGFSLPAQVPAMRILQGKAAMQLGLVIIPVTPADPAYPVYSSQAEWTMGNEESAWDLLDRNWSELLPIHRSLSSDYLLWGLQRVVAGRDEARMKELAMALRAWAHEKNSPWQREQKLELDIAYGDIALQLAQLENAGKIFLAAQQNPDYADLTARHQATLRRVKVDRIAGKFDEALQTLLELDQERIPEMWVPSRYARAEIHYDMEKFEDAAEDIESILARDPGHVDAKIMQGKVHLKQQNLIEASELDVGSRSGVNTLIPGDSLKVTLVDPTLEVTGAGTDIEVVVWTTSGDRETFLLRQFGDEKTKLRGEIPTALGAAYTNDSVLEVKGNDEIFYSYSERFRKNTGLQEDAPGGPITVRSDALLIASPRALLTAAEQRAADTGARLSMQMSGALEALEKAGTPEEVAVAESRLEEVRAKERLWDRIKPGQSINVRVVDPDRSRTAGINEVAVSVEASSGDSISRVVLKETNPHTGIFEGRVTTAGAQAVAYALHSEPGRDPNMVISPTRGYPAWRPQPVAGVEPEFKVDLNNSISLGELVITAKEPGARLKQFFLQTGTGSGDLTTVAVFPNDLMTVAKPTYPSVTIMRDPAAVKQSRSVYDLSALEQYLDRGWMRAASQGVSENVAGLCAALTNAVADKVRWTDPRQSARSNAPVIYRFRSYFYEPEAVTRRFKLELGPYGGKTDPGPVQFLLAVDGAPITDQAQMQKLEGQTDLQPGLHRFEIWATGWSHEIGFGRSVRLLSNLDQAEAGSLGEVPDGFFDPAGFPREAVAHRNGRATITPNTDGTAFTVRFAPDSRARLLNLVIVEQEGSAPALNTLTLKDTGGGRVLPVAEDYAQLRRNDKLEILPDDRIVLRYIDDRFVNKEKHERFLAVAFSTAGIAIRYKGMYEYPNGEKVPYYEDLFRFAHGDTLSIVVQDGDMDLSPEPDKVNVMLASRLGGERTFVATETGPSTATFELVVVPVPDAPAKTNEFQVGKGEFLSATYIDEENTLPSQLPERTVTVRNAVYADPVFRVSHTAAVWPVKAGAPGGDAAAPDRVDRGRAFELPLGFTGGPRVDPKRTADAVGGGILRQALLQDEMSKVISPGGLIYPRWVFSNTTVEVKSPPPDGICTLLGRGLSLFIEAPHLALRPSSSVDVYVQTESGRRAKREGLQASADSAMREEGQGTNAVSVSELQGIDITVPGTIKLRAVLGRQTSFLSTPAIPIYIAPVRPAGSGSRNETTIPMQFAASVPVITGILPGEGVLPDSENKGGGNQRSYGLVVRPGDRIYMGFRYEDGKGAGQWVTGESAVSTHPVLDVMTEDYRETLETAYVGEAMYLRVVDLGADISDQSDTVKVLIQAKSGAKYMAGLPEVDTHSGVFRGRIPLRYASRPGATPIPVADDGSASTNQPAYNVLQDGLPVVYGDVVAMRYTDAKGVHTETRSLRLNKGADATIRPFSKRYNDEDMAMRTQFGLAEANLEMAKRHRRLGQKALAADEYARAKDLLQKAMEMFYDPATRAQAEYMLGNLTQEEAETTGDSKLQQERYRAALSRYMRVTRRYGDTLSAAKAQFMIATVYEALNEPDIAAQEYVKLAYKHPDSEYLALAMARLGTHFLRKAAAYEEQAKKLLAQTGDADALSQGSAMERMYISEYIKSAEIFSRLLSRFPSHELAGSGGLRAGQAYMRAGKNRDAVNVLKRVFDNESYNGPDVRAEAMYWGGLCYDRLNEPMAAYAVFKRLTYDFPESKWAAFARGQLSSEKLLNLEVNLERKRLEEGQ